MAHGIIDQYYNVKVDVATWRKARAELNAYAAEKLRWEVVNLYNEKKLLNGIRAVPDMKLFGIIDQYNKESYENAQRADLQDATLRELNEQRQNLGEEISYEPTRTQENIYAEIASTVGVKEGDIIPADKAQMAQTQIDAFNNLNTSKVLSLAPALGGFLIKTEYKGNYLYEVAPTEMIIEEESLPQSDSNNNFNLPCIK